MLKIKYYMIFADRHGHTKMFVRHKINYAVRNNKRTSKEILIHTRTRSKHGHKFSIKTININAYKYSFFPLTISQLNCLPKALVDSETVDAFNPGLNDLNSPP